MILGKSKILGVGCSFTSGHIMGNESSWLNYLGNLTDTDVINKGYGGASNEMIANSIIDELETNKSIKDDIFVVVQWSECLRTSYWFNNSTNSNLSRWTSITPQHLYMDAPYNDNAEVVHIFNNKKAFYPFHSTMEPSLYRTYTNMIFVKNYLENNNIPYLFFDGINYHKLFQKEDDWYLKASTPFNVSPKNANDDFKVNITEFSLLNPNIVQDIYESKQFFNELNIGMREWLHQKGDTYIKGNEGHPNHKASKEWAEILLKYIKDNLEK